MLKHGLLALSTLPLLVAPAAGASDQEITEALGRAVQPCWMPPQGAEGTAVVQLRIAPDGTLSGKPQLDKRAGEGALGTSALRAVQACAPFPAVGQLLDGGSVDIRATFSLAGFSAVRPAQGAEESAGGVRIQASEDVALVVPEPEGLCYVDPAGAGLQSQYLEIMSGSLAGNHVHGFFLDCATVRQLEDGDPDITLPERTMTLFSPLEPGGGLQRFPERSRAEAVAFYEGFFERQGGPGSAIEERSRDVEERLREVWDVDVQSGRQIVAAVDERAVYTAMFSTAETETGTLRQMSVGSYGQVFDLPVTLSLYAPYEEGGIDALLAEAQALVAAMHANSVRED